MIDAHSIKPIDTVGLHDAAIATGGRIVTVEDHWAEGGLGDAVLAAFAAAGIDASAIADAIRDLVSR